MTVTIALPWLLALAASSTLIGFVFGMCAMLPAAVLPPIRVEPSWAQTGTPGPFPVDTEPLLLLSVEQAAIFAHQREVEAMWVAAEARIGALR